jgi:hypothetical protein
MKRLLLFFLLIIPLTAHNTIVVEDCFKIISAIKKLQQLQNDLPEKGKKKGNRLRDLQRQFNNHMSDFQMYRSISTVKVNYFRSMKGKAESELTKDQLKEINKKREEASSALKAMERVLRKISTDDRSKALMLKQNPDTFFYYLRNSCPKTDISCRKNMDKNSKLIKQLLFHWVKQEKKDGRGANFLKYLKKDLPNEEKREQLLKSWIENENIDFANATERAAKDNSLTLSAVDQMKEEFGKHISKKLNALWERDKILSEKPNDYIPKNWKEFKADLLNSRICKNPIEGTPISLEKCFEKVLGDCDEAILIEEEKEKLGIIQNNIRRIQRKDDYRLISDMLKTLASRSISKKCKTNQVFIKGECFTQKDTIPVSADGSLHALADVNGKIIAELDPNAVSSEKDFIKMCSKKLKNKKMVTIISQVCSGVKPYEVPKAEKSRDKRDYEFNMAQVNEDIICSGDGGVRVMGCVKPKGIWGIIGKTAFQHTLGDPQFFMVGSQTLSFDQTIDPLKDKAMWYKQYLHDYNDWEQNIFFPNFATYFKFQSNPWWFYNGSQTSINTNNSVGSYYDGF